MAGLHLCKSRVSLYIQWLCYEAK